MSLAFACGSIDGAEVGVGADLEDKACEDEGGLGWRRPAGWRRGWCFAFLPVTITEFVIVALVVVESCQRGCPTIGVMRRDEVQQTFVPLSPLTLIAAAPSDARLPEPHLRHLRGPCSR